MEVDCDKEILTEETLWIPKLLMQKRKKRRIRRSRRKRNLKNAQDS